MSTIAKFGCEIKNAKNIALQSSQILYTFVLCADCGNCYHINGPKMVAISACITKVYKICELCLCKAILSAFYNILQPNFAILLILVCSF
jgi:hypothetical protein